MTDGQGGIQLVGLLHSRKRAPSPREDGSAGAAGRGRRRDRRARRAGRARARPPRCGASRDTLDLSARLAVRPWAGVKAAAHFAGSLERVLAPPPTDPSPLLSERSLSWHFDALEVSLDDLKRAGKAAGGSLNDAYIAALLGGLRRYHDELGAPVDSLPMAMPISLRSGDHPMGGNRFAGVALRRAGGRGRPGRADPDDPRVRARRPRRAGDRRARVRRAAAQSPADRRSSPGGTRGQTANLDLQASNVAGLPWEAYIAGAKIERMLPFGPVPGCALMVTLLSYAGTCCIGVNMDAAAVTEPELLMSCLQDGAGRGAGARGVRRERGEN